MHLEVRYRNGEWNRKQPGLWWGGKFLSLYGNCDLYHQASHWGIWSDFGDF